MARMFTLLALAFWLPMATVAVGAQQQARACQTDAIALNTTDLSTILDTWAVTGCQGVIHLPPATIHRIDKTINIR